MQSDWQSALSRVEIRYMGQNAAPKSKPIRRSKKSHEAVLQAASELLVERGYCSVTIDQIADRASVGKQTIYRWWPAKIEIYIELYDGIAKKMLKPVDTGKLESDILEYAEGLSSLLTHPVASLAFRGMVSEAQESEASQETFRRYMLTRFGITRAIIENARVRGELKPKTDIDVLSSLIGGAIVWRLLLCDRLIKKKFVREIAHTVFFGLANNC